MRLRLSRKGMILMTAAIYIIAIGVMIPAWLRLPIARTLLPLGLIVIGLCLLAMALLSRCPHCHSFAPFFYSLKLSKKKAMRCRTCNVVLKYKDDP